MTKSKELIEESKRYGNPDSNKPLDDFLEDCFKKTKEHIIEYLAAVYNGVHQRNRSVCKEDYEDKGLISIPIYSQIFFKFSDLATIKAFGIENEYKEIVMKTWVWQLYCNKLHEKFPDATFNVNRVGSWNMWGDCEIILKEK